MCHRSSDIHLGIHKRSRRWLHRDHSCTPLHPYTLCTIQTHTFLATDNLPMHRSCRLALSSIHPRDKTHRQTLHLDQIQGSLDGRRAGCHHSRSHLQGCQNIRSRKSRLVRCKCRKHQARQRSRLRHRRCHPHRRQLRSHHHTRQWRRAGCRRSRSTSAVVNRAWSVANTASIKLAYVILGCLLGCQNIRSRKSRPVRCKCRKHAPSSSQRPSASASVEQSRASIGCRRTDAIQSSAGMPSARQQSSTS